MGNERFTVHVGDNLPILKTLPDNSVDAIVTDPPAGIGFMQRDWDSDKGGRDKWIDWMAEVAAECLRVIKPGGHALVWALPRTSHWTATAWENAGWEPRDRICHIFGSGFPKSANISKMIDKAAGAEQEVIGIDPICFARLKNQIMGSVSTGEQWKHGGRNVIITAPATDAAKQWDGWGTALKPAVEDYWLFRKPIEKGLNIAANVLKWGTGGLNIDGCRIGTAADMNARDFDDSRRSAPKFSGKFNNGQTGQYRNGSGIVPNGRFPANLIHDGSDEVVRLFPQSTSGANPTRRGGMGYHGAEGQESCDAPRGAESGSAARFFASFPQSKADVLDLLFCRAKAIMSAWNKDIANAAENSLHLSRHHVDSVLSDAVIVATHGGKLLSAWTGLSTGATPNELRIICEMLITAILSIENGQSLVLWQGERTPYNCLVSVAATQKQTDTMTITISLPKLDGSVESVTFNIMPALSAVGAADSAVRFKYCAKASRSEREAGLEELEARRKVFNGQSGHSAGMAPGSVEDKFTTTPSANFHPTVKPIALMRYLCRLVTPPGGIVLDPFTGSGTTGCAAMLEGFRFIGLEREEQYVEIAQKRIEYWRQVAEHTPSSAEQAQMTLLDMQDE